MCLFNIKTIFRSFLFCIALIVSHGYAAAEDSNISIDKEYIISADEISQTKGLVKELVEIDSKPVSILSLPKSNGEESLSVECPKLANGYSGIRIEIDVVATGDSASSKYQDVYAVNISQKDSANKTVNKIAGNLVRTNLPSEPLKVRTIELETCYPAISGLPISIKIDRKSNDSADTFNSSTGLTKIRITPVKDAQKTFLVEGRDGYNSWPMIQALNGKLVCVYSRGSGHTIDEGKRGAYARTSADGGKTWTPEVVVSDNPDYGEVPIGKGLDLNGDALFWIRSVGKGKFFHELYRTKDGVNFTHVATPTLNPRPMQITDVFPVETVGLMALWFSGNYGKDKLNSWGIVVSKDNGATWTQHVIESNLTQTESPTEQSAVYLGDGKILAIGRTEYGDNTTKRMQFQLESDDYGATWKRHNTNISDVSISTPSLVFDKNTGLISNYYYQRGRGLLKRRVVKADEIWGNPLAWPNPELVALGSAASYDAGNVNATVLNGTHILGYYSGEKKNASVVVSEAAAPSVGKSAEK